MHATLVILGAAPHLLCASINVDDMTLPSQGGNIFVSNVEKDFIHEIILR